MGDIAAYVRVSTQDQNLKRQLQSVKKYHETHFDEDYLRIFDDKSTGTDVERQGYQELMAEVEGGDVDAVIAHQVSRIARSISDLQQTADKLKGHGTELHIVQQGLEMRPGETDPYQKALFQMLGVFAELEAEIKRQNIKEGLAARKNSDDYKHGPAPIGFTKDSGQLIEGENYHRVCEVLEQVARDDMSQRQASKELDCGRKTVRSAVDERPELYGL